MMRVRTITSAKNNIRKQDCLAFERLQQAAAQALAIYKVETLNSKDIGKKPGGLKGIKFHCRDIVTGEKRRLLNEKNNNV